MSAFHKFWIVVQDSDVGSDDHLNLPGNGAFQRYFSENNARHAAELLAKQYEGNTYVVLEATGACQAASVQWLSPAPF